MKKILIFSTDQALLSGLKDEFQFYRQIAIIAPRDLKESQHCLTEHKISLAIMEFDASEAEASSLCACIAKNYGGMPVIGIFQDSANARAMTQYPDLIVQQLTKPVNIKELVKHTLEELKLSDPSIIRGIGLAPFLQMIEMEMKSCSLTVKSTEKSGVIYCREGDVIDAETESISGKEAFYDMMCWDNLFIRVDEIDEARERKIDDPLMHLLMESSRIKDAEAHKLETAALDSAAGQEFAEAVQEEGEDISAYLLDDEESEPPLIDVLNNTPGIYEYGIFSNNDSLHIMSAEARSITSLVPSAFFSPAELVNQFLNTGALRYIVVHTEDIRYLLMKHGDSVIAVMIGPGIRPEDIVNKLL